MNGTTNGSAPRPSDDPMLRLKTYSTPHRERVQLGAHNDEEAGAQLRLGDFAGVDSISLSEARLIADVIAAQRAAQGKPVADTDETRKMRSYMEDFSRFNSRATLVELEDIIKSEPALNRFEGSQLGKVCV